MDNADYQRARMLPDYARKTPMPYCKRHKLFHTADSCPECRAQIRAAPRSGNNPGDVLAARIAFAIQVGILFAAMALVWWLA